MQVYLRQRSQDEVLFRRLLEYLGTRLIERGVLNRHPARPQSKWIRTRQIALEIPILERHICRAEISVLERTLSGSGQALPRDEWLLAALGVRETKSEKRVSKAHHTVPRLGKIPEKLTGDSPATG